MPIRSCEFDHVTKTCIIIGLKIYFQNLVQNKNVFCFYRKLTKTGLRHFGTAKTIYKLSGHLHQIYFLRTAILNEVLGSCQYISKGC